MRPAGAASMVAGAAVGGGGARRESGAGALGGEPLDDHVVLGASEIETRPRRPVPLRREEPLESTSEALGRSLGSGASNAATSAVCCAKFARKSSGATPATSAAPLEPLFGFAARSAPSSTARSIPVEKRRSIS